METGDTTPPYVRMNDKKVYTRDVVRITTAVTTSKDADVPLVLLDLKPIVESPTLDSKGLIEVKNQIWRCDLIHVVIEVLRQDFSLVQGKWNTAAQLAATLGAICAGFNPRLQRAHNEDTGVSSEQVKEYYEILLPTATDSLLILANNLLELESASTQQQSGAAHASFLEQFHSVMDSLTWLCTSHKQCTIRALQSPYLLHMLITDNAQYSQVVLITLSKLVKANKSVLSSLSVEILHGILDELVYKVSGKEKRVATLSLKLLATFVGYDPNLFAIISSRYKGVLTVVLKWKDLGLGRDVELFIGQLEANSAVEKETDRIDHAAVVIQASWRGYSSRKRIRRMHRGIRRFQQLYRKRKAEQTRLKTEQTLSKNVQESRKVALQTSLRTFHEKQMRMVEQLPASQVDHFVLKQREEAATKLQSWWWGRLARKKYGYMRTVAKVNTSVVVLQRAVRKYLKRKRALKEARASPLFLPITGAEREALQKEITQCRELHLPARCRPEDQLRQLHEEVQELLGDFYSTRHTEKHREERRALLLSQLNRDCELLLSAPSLGEVTLGAMDTFSSGSAAIARMAQTAHREELKALELPWWKRPLFDSDDISL